MGQVSDHQPCFNSSHFVKFVVLLPEHEVHRCHQTEERSGMVPMEVFALEHERGDNGEHRERHHFLNHLQLHQRIGTAIAHKTQLVGWHLQRILEERDAP